MAQHSRPVPSPRTAALPPYIVPTSPRQPDDAPPRDAAPVPTAPVPAPTMPDAPAAAVLEPASADLAVCDSGDADQPWYRSEPWLAVVFGALVPIAFAIVVPGWPKFALLGLGALMTVLGLVLLVRRDGVARAALAARSVRPQRP